MVAVKKKVTHEEEQSPAFMLTGLALGLLLTQFS